MPLSEGTVETLEKNMVHKAREFRLALKTMNDEYNVEYNGDGHVRDLIKTIRGLSGEEANPVASLRKSLRISRKIMVHLNREILEKELHNNEDFARLYEKAANLLFRANDSRSVRCLALWALKRRIVKQTVFAELYWSEPIPEQFTSVPEVVEVQAAINVIVKGHSGEAVDHLESQRSAVENYIEKVLAATRAIASKSAQADGPSAGVFYKRYFLRMGRWKHSLKNIAL